MLLFLVWILMTWDFITGGRVTAAVSSGITAAGFDLHVEADKAQKRIKMVMAVFCGNLLTREAYSLGSVVVK
jgi:hypothetical protein